MRRTGKTIAPSIACVASLPGDIASRLAKPRRAPPRVQGQGQRPPRLSASSSPPHRPRGWDATGADWESAGGPHAAPLARSEHGPSASLRCCPRWRRIWANVRPGGYRRSRNPVACPGVQPLRAGSRAALGSPHPGAAFFCPEKTRGPGAHLGSAPTCLSRPCRAGRRGCPRGRYGRNLRTIPGLPVAFTRLEACSGSLLISGVTPYDYRVGISPMVGSRWEGTACSVP